MGRAGGSTSPASPTWRPSSASALEQFPGVKLIPFGWVAFFIFLYILLIGPGDYFFLKKVLKRMELTWITFPTIVVAVSLLAYYAAYLLKGNELLVNQVDVVDVDQVDGLVRGSTWASMFSPQNRDYNDPCRSRCRWTTTPPRRQSGTERRAARAPARDQRHDELVQLARGSVRCHGELQPAVQLRRQRLRVRSRPAGVEKLEGVRIPIWSTKCVTARWFGPAGTPGRCRPRPVGTDRLAGTVTNRLDIPLEDAILAFGKQVYTPGHDRPRRDHPGRADHDRSLVGLHPRKQPKYLDPTYGTATSGSAGST